jgi:DNA-binding SARP family transcriptional activator/tetratricopeptide (TPR) repeat protein
MGEAPASISWEILGVWYVTEIRLLGVVEVWRAGAPVPAGQPRQRGVLAALAVDVGRPVSLDGLVYRVWGESPPNRVRTAVYAYITQLRHLLGRPAPGQPGALHRTQGGYVLRLEPDAVDLHRFRTLVDGSARADDPGRAGLLREALALWQGDPLAGIGGPWAERMRRAWREEQLAALLSWARTEQRLDRPAAVVGPLVELLADNPLVEPLAVELMRALCACGRRAEALECYAATRRRLVEELGAEPGIELRELHRQILVGDRATRVAAVPEPSPVPAQLPRDLPSFSGRTRELARLDTLTGPSARTAAAVAVVAGTAGVGKTTLVLHWAHRVADHFPDGQLYLNLRGFAPVGTPVAAATAVRHFLDALGVPPQRIPADLDTQAALYRSRLAGRRVLIILDNAVDAEQVRPLLPATPGCVAVVTSRRQLYGLVAEGAQPIDLDLPSARESRDLLAGRIGYPRVKAEPVAVTRIVERCGRLPLALAIVAARVATRADRLAAFADELTAVESRLDALDSGDEATRIRAVFSWSYASVSTGAARVFRLLGLCPGPDVSLSALASLCDQPVATVRVLLAELSQVHLVGEPSSGRFNLHDLLRAYAIEQARCEDTAAVRHDATERLLDHYLHMAHLAGRLTNPHREPVTLAAASPGVVIDPLSGHADAMRWLAVERGTLLSVLEHTAANGWHAHTWQLGWTVADYLYRRGHWHDQVTAGCAAVTAAERAAGPIVEARAHRSLARAYVQLADYERARTHLCRAMHLIDDDADPAGQADAHHVLSWVMERRGHHDDAFTHAGHALALYRVAEDRAGEANTLNTIGWFHTQLGDHRQALTFCRKALRLHRRLGHREGQATTLRNIGHAHHQLGDHRRAIVCCQHSLTLFREVQNRYYEGHVLAIVGDTHDALGDRGAAETAWRQALTVLDDLHHPDADQVRAKLR